MHSLCDKINSTGKCIWLHAKYFNLEIDKSSLKSMKITKQLQFQCKLETLKHNSVLQYAFCCWFCSFVCLSVIYVVIKRVRDEMLLWLHTTNFFFLFSFVTAAEKIKSKSCFHFHLIYYICLEVLHLHHIMRPQFTLNAYRQRWCNVLCLSVHDLWITHQKITRKKNKK